MRLKSELYRKIFHLLIVIFPILYSYLGKWHSILIFAIIALIIMPLDYLRCNNSGLNKFFNKFFAIIARDSEKEAKELCGFSFVLLASCVNFLVFSYEIAIIAFLILAISDCLAALVGKSIDSGKFYEKTIAGSVAFFISALIILVICAIYFNMALSFYVFSILAISFVTILEARPSLLKINDNFIIPIAFSTIVTVFDFIYKF